MPLSGTISTMTRVFKTRHFQRWMRKTELTDAVLCKAVQEMAAGLIDADLGGSVVKKRVGLAGRGKRGGVRTLVATNKGNRWFFVFGFEKNADRWSIRERLRGCGARSRWSLANLLQSVGDGFIQWRTCPSQQVGGDDLQAFWLLVADIRALAVLLFKRQRRN